MNWNSGDSPRSAISLDQLVALNDEIISLVEAGVPLELGLKELGRDQSDALARISGALADRMTRGESLPAALSAEEDQFPKVYRAVVEAGLRTGRLSAALEALSGFAWELVDLRRRVGTALLYPTLVLLTAYGLFFVFIMELVRRIYESYIIFRIPVSPGLEFLIRAQETVVYWWWILPACVLAFFGYWMSTGGPDLLTFEGWNRPLGWIPGMKRIGTSYRYANFADLLALMVEHNVPLSEGVLLAADATGDERMQSSARTLADATDRGESPASGTSGDGGFPPYLHWLLVRGSRQGALSQALRMAGDRYRRRAVEQTEWFKLAFPITAAIIIGGGATIFYALALFWPFTRMLTDMAQQEAPW